MDVLLGSIDVRDLLSTADLDASSPLSAPDLRLLIDRLNLRSISIKSSVRSYALNHRHDFAGIFSLSASSSASSASLASSLAAALQLLSDRPVDAEICGIAREICEKRRELEEKREALGVVEVVNGFVERLGFVKERWGDGEELGVKEAAVMMKELKEGLRVGDGGEEEAAAEEPSVFGFLRKEWMDCFDELKEILAKNVEKAVQVEVEDGTVIIKSKPKFSGMSGADLYTTLVAMEIVGVLDYGLGKLADLMIKHVISPAISTASVDIFVEELDESLGEKCEAILKLLPSSEYRVSFHFHLLITKL